MDQGLPDNSFKPPVVASKPPEVAPVAANATKEPVAANNAAANNTVANATKEPVAANNTVANNTATNASKPSEVANNAPPNNATKPSEVANNAPPNNATKLSEVANNAPPNNVSKAPNVAPNNTSKAPNNASKAVPINTSKASEKRPFFAYTQGSFWGGPNADYTTLAILACFPLTGMIGLDHAYMRSPLTAVIKTILNVFTLGLWYFFDAAQVLTEGDKIRNIGYSMPVFGPTGLGAGIFTNEDEKPSGPGPIRFLVYALAALIPLPFGQDFFAAGDIWGGIAKLVTLFMPLLWIFGLAWGIYVVYRLFFQTEALITEGVPRFFPWTIIMDDFYCSRNILGPDRECGDPEAASKGGLLWSIGQMLRGIPIIGRAVDPIMSATETAANTAKAVVEKSVQPSIQFATASVGAAKEIISTVPQVAANVANQAQAFTDPAKLQQLATQRGGAIQSKSMTPLIVLLVAGLASSGFFLAKLRSMVDFDLSKLSRAIKTPTPRGPTDQPPGRSL
jgi:hypothetical protein